MFLEAADSAGNVLPFWRARSSTSIGASVPLDGRKHSKRATRLALVLRSSHEGVLAYCSLADLKRFAIDLT